ncbi:MAG: PorP/SprF family type IX secretion system membrane protein [Flavipsychrobacter sp.]
MKKLLFTILLLSACLVVKKPLWAQDVHFSQFYENSIMRNPALTGIFSGDYKIGVNYRTQWSSLAVPFQTVLMSAESRILVGKEAGDYLSFGISAAYDKAGTISFNTMQVYPAINYNKNLEDKHGSFLSVGFAAGYIQRSIDFSKATFSSQYVNGGYSQENLSGENMNNTTIQNYDLAAGISFNSSALAQNNLNYYLGLAAYHITKPKHSFSSSENLIRLTTRWTGNAGLKWTFNNAYMVTAHANFNIQNPYQEIMYGGFIGWQNSAIVASKDYRKYFSLHAGVFVRKDDAIIPSLKIDYTHFTFLLSYDINNSTLNSAGNSNGYEMSVYIRGKYKNKNSDRTYNFACPRFENMPNVNSFTN